MEPENWPPNGPDLNRVDYSVWGPLQQLVYRRRRIRDVEHLKEVLQTLLGADWSRRYRLRCRTFWQTIVNLSLVVATCGGRNEQSFD